MTLSSIISRMSMLLMVNTELLSVLTANCLPDHFRKNSLKCWSVGLLCTKMKLMQHGTKLSEASTLIRLNLYSKEEFFMFISNGIVYASERPENVQIIGAKPLDDMMMLLTFSTGEQRLFDASVLNGPAFAPLTDEKIFKDCKIVDGVVTWMDEDIDCAPEYMYEHSYAYPSLKSVI
nr:MAG TPA: Protein of unknown function (DUF2442) [Caudoviricetes sp.]